MMTPYEAITRYVDTDSQLLSEALQLIDIYASGIRHGNDLLPGERLRVIAAFTLWVSPLMYQDVETEPSSDDYKSVADHYLCAMHDVYRSVAKGVCNLSRANLSNADLHNTIL